MMTRVDIMPNGEVRFVDNGGKQPQWLSLNGIVFHLEDKIEIDNAER